MLTLAVNVKFHWHANGEFALASRRDISSNNENAPEGGSSDPPLGKGKRGSKMLLVIRAQ